MVRCWADSTGAQLALQRAGYSAERSVRPLVVKTVPRMVATLAGWKVVQRAVPMAGCLVGSKGECSADRMDVRWAGLWDAHWAATRAARTVVQRACQMAGQWAYCLVGPTADSKAAMSAVSRGVRLVGKWAYYWVVLWAVVRVGRWAAGRVDCSAASLAACWAGS